MKGLNLAIGLFPLLRADVLVHEPATIDAMGNVKEAVAAGAIASTGNSPGIGGVALADTKQPQSIGSVFGMDGPTIVAWNITTSFPYISFVLPEGKLTDCTVTLTDKALVEYKETDKLVEESNFLTTRFSFMKADNSTDEELGRTFIVFRPLSCYTVNMKRPTTAFDRSTQTLTVNFKAPAETTTTTTTAPPESRSLRKVSP